MNPAFSFVRFLDPKQQQDRSKMPGMNNARRYVVAAAASCSSRLLVFESRNRSTAARRLASTGSSGSAVVRRSSPSTGHSVSNSNNSSNNNNSSNSNSFCFRCASTISTTTTRRRPRHYVGHGENAGTSLASNRQSSPDNDTTTTAVPFGALVEPHRHGEANMDDYLRKASLSPWTPIPDSVARKLMDMAQAVPTDFHVDLGSGDGRVTFCAIDYGVQQSLGVDVDETLVELAQHRLAKRHPPPNLEFVVADLLDTDTDDTDTDTGTNVWSKIKEATIITMYFASPALERLRPILEHQLANNTSCRILTCGYEMPNWPPALQTEVVLGTQIHLYHWKGSRDLLFADRLEEDAAMNDGHHQMFKDNANLQVKLDELAAKRRSLEGTQFSGSKVIDRTGQFHPRLQGYNPNLKYEEEDDDEDWDALDAAEEDTAKKNGTRDKKSKPSRKKGSKLATKSGCSKL